VKHSSLFCFPRDKKRLVIQSVSSFSLELVCYEHLIVNVLPDLSEVYWYKDVVKWISSVAHHNCVRNVLPHEAWLLR
jgi:hypothetical protein